MSGGKLSRPDDSDYYVPPWSEGLLQGDLFKDVPLGFACPPDAVVMAEGERRFITGPFDAGPAMLISPSCAIAAQGAQASPGMYAHPARIMAPVRPVSELLEQGVVNEDNLAMLKADRLVNYLYLPADGDRPEGAALLYLPITVHHDVIKEDRIAQLTGTAFWHLRVKMMAFYGSFLLDQTELGDPPAAQDRTR
jgi:hypothetical protein